MFHAWCIPVFILFMIYGIFVLMHAISIKRTKNPEILEFVNDTTWLNEVLLAGLFFASGALWPFIYDPTTATEQGIDVLYAVSTAFILLVSAIWYVQGTFNHFRCKNNHEEMQKRLDLPPPQPAPAQIQDGGST